MGNHHHRQQCDGDRDHDDESPISLKFASIDRLVDAVTAPCRQEGEHAAESHHATFYFMKTAYRDRFAEIAAMYFPSGWVLTQKSDANPAPYQS